MSQITLPITFETNEKLAITVKLGDVTDESVDVIINSTTSNLCLDAGTLSSSIFRAAGKNIQGECSAKYPTGVRRGAVAVTTGGNLKAGAIYHGALPPHQAGKGEKHLSAFTGRFLAKAHEEGKTSLAIPAIGTGNLAFPLKTFASILNTEIMLFSKNNPDTTLKDIRIVFLPATRSIQEFSSVFTSLQKRRYDWVTPVNTPQVNFLTESSRLEFRRTLVEPRNRAIEVSSHVSSHDTPTIESESTPSLPGYVGHLKSALDGTLGEMKEYSDPVTILKCFRKWFLRGRQLNITSEAETPGGETTEIFVSRDNLFEDSVAELSQDNIDFSFPLAVQFIEEMAADLGGPRREYLRGVMREVMEQLFIEKEAGCVLFEDVASLHGRKYYTAGLIIALALLEEGPSMNKFHSDCLKTLFEHPTTEAEKQVHKGLGQFGLPDLFLAKPSLYLLLRYSPPTKMSYACLAKELTPVFSEVGHNQLQDEKKVHRSFLNYLKEVHAGRRAGVTLEKVLAFVTGAASQPLLGWSSKPIIEFQELPGHIPISNTCINKLVIPLSGNAISQEALFDKFDMAFINSFFGKV